MLKKLKSFLKEKKILILGYGREGQASLKLLISILSFENIAVADQSQEVLNDIQKGIKRYYGDAYLNNANDYDLIIKSPGIPSKKLLEIVSASKITSQTDLFLMMYKHQVIGITGTKGKSTTSSLIHHIFNVNGYDTILVGNIGVPPFEMLKNLKPSTKIIFEMSSHQLENVRFSPQIAVLLNLFQEHLDHYPDFNAYQLAKWKITAFQNEDDYFYFNGADDLIKEKISLQGTNAIKEDFSFVDAYDRALFINKYDLDGRLNLPGIHNLLNVKVAVNIAKKMGVKDSAISVAIKSYSGLPHRMQYIGEYGQIKFYDDSISTIPESTIEAVKALINVDTLLLGGKDRGVEFSGLIEFLTNHPINNLIFMGAAGQKIMNLIMRKNVSSNLFLINKFEEIAEIIKNNTAKGKICLLSPAASSYDWFKDYADRGNQFCKIVKSL